jgi:hypothetical protein
MVAFVAEEVAKGKHPVIMSDAIAMGVKHDW